MSGFWVSILDHCLSRPTAMWILPSCQIPSDKLSWQDPNQMSWEALGVLGALLRWASASRLKWFVSKSSWKKNDVFSSPSVLKARIFWKPDFELPLVGSRRIFTSLFFAFTMMKSNHTKQRTITCLILPAPLRMARPMCRPENMCRPESLLKLFSRNLKMPELAFYGSLATSYASCMSDRVGDEAPVVSFWKLELRCALCSVASGPSLTEEAKSSHLILRFSCFLLAHGEFWIGMFQYPVRPACALRTDRSWHARFLRAFWTFLTSKDTPKNWFHNISYWLHPPYIKHTNGPRSV